MARYTQEQAPQDMGLVQRYDLSQDEVRAETAAFLVQAELPLHQFVCVAFASDHPMANVARTIEREAFEPKFGNDSADMKRMYGPYEDKCLFLVVIDAHAQAPAGMLRIIQPSPVGFKTSSDLADNFPSAQQRLVEGGEVDLNQCFDVGTLAVSQVYRGDRSDFEVSTLLCRGLLLSARRQGIQHMITVLDKRARTGLEVLGVRFREVNGALPVEYEGSKESYFMYAGVEDLEDSARAAYEAAARGAEPQSRVEKLRMRIRPEVLLPAMARLVGSADDQIVPKPYVVDPTAPPLEHRRRRNLLQQIMSLGRLLVGGPTSQSHCA